LENSDFEYRVTGEYADIKMDFRLVDVTMRGG